MGEKLLLSYYIMLLCHNLFLIIFFFSYIQPTSKGSKINKIYFYNWSIPVDKQSSYFLIPLACDNIYIYRERESKKRKRKRKRKVHSWFNVYHRWKWTQ